MKRFSSCLACLLVLSFCDTVEAQMNTSPFELTEIFRIGDEEGGDSIFVETHLYTQIAVNSVNQLFVGGWRVSPVMSFSDEGRFIGYLGAKGKGPGEFENSRSVVVGPGDSIHVFDSELERLLVYEPQTLQFAYSRNTVEAVSNISSPSELLGVTDQGYLFEFRTPYRPPGNKLGVEPYGPRFNVINLLDRKGTMVKKSVAKLPAGERLVQTSQSSDESSIAVRDLPFGRDPFFVFNNSNVYAGWNDVIDIAVISEKGEPVRTIRIAHEASPVTRRDIEGIVKDATRRVRRWVLESESIPETKPAYDALVVDDQGRLWIREYPDTEAEFAKWLIVNSNGELVGAMELPENLLLKEIKAGRAYASVYSETYGPYIVVYAITE